MLLYPLQYEIAQSCKLGNEYFSSQQNWLDIMHIGGGYLSITL